MQNYSLIIRIITFDKMSNKEIEILKNYKKKIANYCSLKERSEFDVIKKMHSWQFPKEIQEDLICYLTTNNYLNEERFCREFCRGKFKIKRWGKNKIIAELSKKRVPKKIIDTGLNEIEEDQYLIVLNELLQKKKNTLSIKNKLIRNKKIANFLIQRGFEPFLVWDNINIKDDN